MPADSDNDGIANFMDPDYLRPETVIYENNTTYVNGTGTNNPQTVTETPTWAWGAVVAAVLLGVLAVAGFMRGRKPVRKNDDAEQ